MKAARRQALAIFSQSFQASGCKCEQVPAYCKSLEDTIDTSMLRSIVVSSTTAAVFGLACATLGATTFGTAAIPFIVGTSSGFIFGAYSHYRSSVVESAQFLKDMPELFHFHIRRTFPATFRQVRFTNVFDDGWVGRSMAIAALFSASTTLVEIAARQEQELIEKYGKLSDAETLKEE
jgi:hypothetical protein